MPVTLGPDFGKATYRGVTGMLTLRNLAAKAKKWQEKWQPQSIPGGLESLVDQFVTQADRITNEVYRQDVNRFHRRGIGWEDE